MMDAKNKIAIKAVPAIVKGMMPGASAVDITKIVAIITANIIKYGYESGKIVWDTRLAAVKEFWPVALEFFDNLNSTVNDTIQMSMALSDKHYSRIIDFVLANEDVSFDTKIATYRRIEKDRREHQLEMTKTVLRTVGGTIVTVGTIVAGTKVNTSKPYNKRKTQEAKYKYKYKSRKK